MSEIENKLFDAQIPEYYYTYHNRLLENLKQNFNLASIAKKKKIDVSEFIESKIVYDLADRVAKMHDIDIADRLRILLSQMGKELAALKIAEEIALGEYGIDDIENRLNNAVRVSLAVVTEGVTVAPLQGISDVKIKINSDNSRYLCVSFAGPIRSAGGTEAALTLLIADHIRKVVGLEKYVANCYDDESGRFVEELRIYEREVGNFQFKVSDEDVIKCITSLPVEIDGVDTDPVDVVGHRNMSRISTNRVRGGTLRVMNDGLIGRSRKLMKLVETLDLQGWNWLTELNGAIQTGNDDVVHHRMNEVITGRPVLSMIKKIGGFRLRYGRSCNTGFATVGIHPTIPILLDNAIVIGTQIKMDVPGKASTVALVDTIEPPIVKLLDQSVAKIKTISEAKSILHKVEKILYLGDILISYGDFLENNSELLPASYVEEIWALDLNSKLKNIDSLPGNFLLEKLISYIERPLLECPSVQESFEISTFFGIPLHPKYVFYYGSITPQELIFFIQEIHKKTFNTHLQKNLFLEIDNKIETKKILEKLGILHSLSFDTKFIQINDPDTLFILSKLYFKIQEKYNLIKINNNDFNSIENTLDFVSEILDIRINHKFLSSIAVRVGRPEKAAERRMKPPVHVLFPVGLYGGTTRDILKAANVKTTFYVEISNRYCKNCNLPSSGNICRKCYSLTPLQKLCSVCKKESYEELSTRCKYCKNEYRTYSPINYPIKKAIKDAESHLAIKIVKPLKGVKSLIGENKSAEPLEKGILRVKHELYTFKDGTIRFDATNEPITHFKPKWILTSIEKLKELGYIKDYLGHQLNSVEQLTELFIQDIIIPINAGEHLLKVTQFIDEELVKFYGVKPFYNALKITDLVGHLVVGLAPHTSVGIIGRIIGFVNSQVCLASPIWHSAKRRDCDGDADSLMLLMDLFLNFSYEYLSNKIGGLMDAPLLVQPIVYPHEVQRQALNIDISQKYPIEFYLSTLENKKAIELVNVIEILKKRIGQINQFYDYNFTHTTDSIVSEISRSSYSTLNTMNEKLNMQIKTAKLIDAVDPDEVVSMVLTTHILPDIMGNMRAYSSQAFRCTKCGQKYRRMPLLGKCVECKHELLQTVTRGSVEKYVGIASDICSQFKINEYLLSRVECLKNELNLIFKQKQKEQFTITDFV